jgi:fructosamine-3-kinase
MSYGDGEIPWSLLRRIVHKWAGDSAELVEVTPLTGGSINTTLLLLLKDGQRAVIKVSVHRINLEFEREAHQLNVLSNIGIPTPNVIDYHVGSLDNPNSYLLLEYVDGVNLNRAKQHCSPEQADALQKTLAELVVKLHANCGDQYGRVTPNDSPKFDDWPSFYRHIYDPVVKEVENDAHLHVKQRRLIHRIHERLEHLLAHDDCPRLVHWDIWSANLLLKLDDNGFWQVAALFDPQCKYAHAEAEIAYMDLFHTSAPAFNREYQHTFKLDDGYHHMRKFIYQLYPLLNHVQLFGAEYVKPLSAALDRAATLV